MADTSAGLPSLVYKRDGRLVDFEADKISQSLYAATEELGRPSAFLARELTDGVLHFLAADVGADQPTTAQIAELIVKVVRELGQPALSQVVAEGQRRKHQEPPAVIQREKSARSAANVQFSTTDNPDDVVRRSLRSYSLHAVFARDLAAAHEEGLITLAGLENPDELARIVVEPIAGAGGRRELWNTPARMLIFDSPEYALTEETARPWLWGLGEICAATGRDALLNLHVATAPPWANPSAQGPLFGPAAAAPPGPLSSVAGILVEEIQREGLPLFVAWHLSEVDFAAENQANLEKIARPAAEGSWRGFTMDRPKHPLALGPGVNRGHAAALADVHLDLPRFLNMSGVNQDARLFLEKLPSLARMAVRAGVQKRNYLRSRAGDRPSLARSFLIERASLVVVPVGLNQVVTDLLGHDLAGGKLALDMGRQVVETLQRTLQQESLAANLDIGIDGPAGEFPGFAGPIGRGHWHAAGVLHGVAGFGSVSVAGTTAEELLTLLPYVWKKTDVVRLVR